MFAGEPCNCAQYENFRIYDVGKWNVFLDSWRVELGVELDVCKFKASKTLNYVSFEVFCKAFIKTFGSNILVRVLSVVPIKHKAIEKPNEISSEKRTAPAILML